MTATVADVRRALADALGTISGLRAYAHWPDNIESPAAIVLPIEGEYHQAMGMPGYSGQTYQIVLLAASIQLGYVRGQEAIDRYLDVDTPESIKAAVERDKTLGGTVTTCHIEGWIEYGSVAVNNESQAGGVEYWGAKLTCSVVP
jgi:hypothetical protein